MELSNIKKNNEHVWASIFTRYINEEFKANYRLVPELQENSPVDMHMVSDDAAEPHLELQLTHAVEVPFVALQNHTDVDYSKQPTIDAIERKLVKLTEQGADLSKIILIIQGYMNKISAQQVFDDVAFHKYAFSPFQAIYYVSPSAVAAETNQLVGEGVVVPIKPLVL